MEKSGCGSPAPSSRNIPWNMCCTWTSSSRDSTQSCTLYIFLSIFLPLHVFSITFLKQHQINVHVWCWCMCTEPAGENNPISYISTKQHFHLSPFNAVHSPSSSSPSPLLSFSPSHLSASCMVDSPRLHLVLRTHKREDVASVSHLS